MVLVERLLLDYTVFPLTRVVRLGLFEVVESFVVC